MARVSIDGATLLDPEGGFSGPGRVLVDDGRIEVVLAPGQEGFETAGRDAERRDATGLLLAPGFIDLHFHGELLFARPETFAAALARASAALAGHGTTAFLATTVAWPADRIREYVTRLAEEMTQARHGGARPIGLHLEGPWINPEAAGAQPRVAIRPFRSEDGEILDACGDSLAMVTLAPELPGADQLLDALHRRSVIAALGHSRAEAPLVEETLRRGLTHVTHLFNAMGGLHHRSPGLPGAILGARTPVSCDLICDGVHVAPELVRVAARCLGERLSLISDRIDPVPVEEAQREPGEPGLSGAGPAEPSDFGSGELVDDGTAWRLVSDGRLAGSQLTLDRAVRNAVAYAAMTPLEAIAAVTLRPARLLGREREIGTLRPGARADLVLLDPDLRVVETYVAGRSRFRSDARSAPSDPSRRAAC